MSSNAEIYTPPSSQFSNANLNALSSPYASAYGYATTSLISRYLEAKIWDAAPQQYFEDLYILNQVAAEQVPSDEYTWQEAPYGRDSIVVTAANAGGGASMTITVTPASTGVVAVDTVVTFPNNSKGIVASINTALNQITINSMTGATLPAVAVNDTIANATPLEADGASVVMQGFRQNTIERVNFTMMLSKMIQYGKMEMFKYEKSGTTDYLDFNFNAAMLQYRTDISNNYWNGSLGQFTLNSGLPAKTTQGVFPSMQAAGSLVTNTTIANIGAALETAALASEYNPWGDTRFFYATPTVLLQISEYYKNNTNGNGIRYDAYDMFANQYFESIRLGSSRIMFVPMKRFESTASFPAFWANMGLLLDQRSIFPVYSLPNEVTWTLDRSSGANLNLFKSIIFSGTFGIKFKNPLGSAILTIS